MVLFAPTLKVALPNVTLPPVVPPPVSEPIWVLKPLRSSVAPAVLAKLTAELIPSAPLVPATEATPTCSVPPFTVVGPV